MTQSPSSPRSSLAGDLASWLAQRPHSDDGTQQPEAQQPEPQPQQPEVQSAAVQQIYGQPRAGQDQLPYPGQAQPPSVQQYYGQPIYAQPQPGAYTPPVQAGEPKSKSVAAALAFFLGWTGAHSFYRGQQTRGRIHVVLAGACGVMLLFGIYVIATQTDAYGELAPGEAFNAGMALMTVGLLGTVNVL
ncbi:MAG: NINE protein [Actinomyces urogenitalis]|uniref:TM2 domain-containing protein n=1 Tax=Actinomyces urogenitalis TaxID=103621 RepID=UPI00290F9B34|nr:NINE protein [Actinomyces urogenitalis]MDU6152507.1 NINE protein [Actinomyces urogenitalis]